MSPVLKRILALLLPSALAATSALAIETRFENDPSLPIVYLNVAVKAGAANDPKGQSGIANFVGEMMLRGTKNRSKQQIDEQLDQLGATLDVETRAEALIFRGRVLSSRLAEYMEIVQDILLNPSFPSREIAKLKGEVVSSIIEARGKDNGLGKIFWESFLFEGHPYGKPILGKTKDLEALKRDDLVRHYASLFQDRNLLVVGSGDADTTFVEAWAARIAEKRPNGSSPNPIVVSDPPKPWPARRILFVDKPDRTQTQVYFGQIGKRMTDPDFFPLYLSNHVFGGGSFSARMMTEVRVKRGWSYGAASFFRHGIRPRSWQAYTFPAAKDTEGALGLVSQMLRDWKEKGITPEEYAFAKASLINSAGFTYNTPAKRVENILLEKTLDLPDGFMKTYAKNLEKVSIDDANRVVRDYIDPDKMSVMVLGTAKDLKPKVAKALGAQESEIRVVPYTRE
jgi:zinc protease